MKPGQLQRKTRMSRCPKQSIGKAKAEAWKWFSRFIRLRDSFMPDQTTEQLFCKCVTCGNIYPMTGKGCIQAGHFIPGRHNAVLYDERNVHAQCHICNRWKRGEWVAYERFMLERYGAQVVQELKDLDRRVLTMTAADHLSVAEVYRGKVAGLGGWPESQTTANAVGPNSGDKAPGIVRLTPKAARSESAFKAVRAKDGATG